MDEIHKKKLLEAAMLLGLIAMKKVMERKIQRKTYKRKRVTWQEKWLKRREEGRGVLNMVRDELLVENPDMYRNYLRMNNNQFNELLSLIETDISRTDTQFRQCISTEKRLGVTLRYLATGCTYRDLMFATRIHESTISLIVPEVCQAITNRLMDTYLKMPNTKEEWLKIAKDFETLWNFPNCIGAIDGKHINFQAPRSSGSFYYNYKGNHSIVLLALVDANYKFLYVDVGVNGRNSDGGVYRESSLKKGIDRDIFKFPNDSNLSGSSSVLPYVMVADDAFPLTRRIMKPYPSRGLSKEKRIFNYRLSRARRIVENAFGILSNRFRIFLQAINLSPEKVETITLASCVLHNFLATKNQMYSNVDPKLDQIVSVGLSNQSGPRSSNEAIAVRDKFRDYFNSSVGMVEWQNKAIGI